MNIRSENIYMVKSKHSGFIAVLIWLIVSLPGQAVADHITGGKVSLRLSTISEFRPFIWNDESGTHGIDYDIVKEMCRRLDLHCRVEFHPWKRVLSRIEDGSSDGGFSGFKTPEREAYADFLSRPLHYSTYSIFVRTGDEFTFNTIEDLYGKTIGVMRGFKINPEFHGAVAQGRINLQEVNSMDQNIRLLTAGRIDAIAVNYHKMRMKMSELGISGGLTGLPVPITPPRPSYLMISKKWIIPFKEDLLRQMDDVMESMYEDGTIDKINSTYLD
ncbi:MAG: transporter substrate-binding domain-containing protein [Desulfobacterales bacterium]|nr:transporter substrate-binding domain-containing protein [Desulfobacterales bacterium]